MSPLCSWRQRFLPRCSWICPEHPCGLFVRLPPSLILPGTTASLFPPSAEAKATMVCSSKSRSSFCPHSHPVTIRSTALDCGSVVGFDWNFHLFLSDIRRQTATSMNSRLWATALYPPHISESAPYQRVVLETERTQRFRPRKWNTSTSWHMLLCCSSKELSGFTAQSLGTIEDRTDDVLKHLVRALIQNTESEGTFYQLYLEKIFRVFHKLLISWESHPQPFLMVLKKGNTQWRQE